MNLTDLLPSSSFVKCTVVPISSASILWENRRLQPKRRLLEYGYVRPDSSVKSNLPGDCRTVYGERYGGQGLAANGGGVRCGLMEDVQIKGVGPNQLAGATTEFFHRFGGATLQEGILEATWGEIVSQVLPYGSARTFGLLDTSTTVPVKFPRTDGPTQIARVLILREPKLRPAHFFRAVFFKPNDATGLLHDTERTRRAIQRIDHALACHDLIALENSVNISSIEQGLVNLFVRHAHQIGAARAKRLMHGSLTSSNVGMDGSWLDFGSISALNDYGRIIIPRGAPDFLREEALFFNTAENLIFYLRKYFPRFAGESELTAAQLFTVMQKEIQRKFSRELIKLSGFSESQLKTLPRDITHNFAEVLQTIQRCGNLTPFTILSVDNDKIPTMPHQTGTYHLNTILQQLAMSDTPAIAELRVTALPSALRHKLISTYFACLNGLAHEQDEATERLVTRLHALRLNAPLTRLWRTNLYPEIEHLTLGKDDVQALINELVEYGIERLSNEDEVTFKARDNLCYVLNREGLFRAGLRLGADEALDVIQKTFRQKSYEKLLAAA